MGQEASRLFGVGCSTLEVRRSPPLSSFYKTTPIRGCAHYVEMPYHIEVMTPARLEKDSVGKEGDPESFPSQQPFSVK